MTTQTTGQKVQTDLAEENANRAQRVQIEKTVNALMAQNGTNIAKLGLELHKASINRIWLPDYENEKAWISATMPKLDYNKALRLRKCAAHESIGPRLAELGYSRANALINSGIQVKPEHVQQVIAKNIPVSKIKQTVNPPSAEALDELANLLESRSKIAKRITKLSADLAVIDEKIKLVQVAS